MTFKAIILALMFLGGCCSVPPHVPFECPDRPELSEYSDAEWSAIPEDSQVKISNDDLSMKNYILNCEARAKIHND